MKPWLDIVMPVRNPGDMLLESVDSLLAQTARGFGVVISNNHSSSGAEIISEACSRLRRAEIPVTVVSPRFELGRVEHWNWAHAQGAASWLKPLFVGDLVASRYVEAARARLDEQPRARLLRCDLEFRTSLSTHRARVPGDRRSFTPLEFLAYYPHLGNWIGGPANTAFERNALQSVGGFAVQYPVCADLRLLVMLALQHGLESIPEPLATFQLHDQRFSKGIMRRRVNSCLELFLILREARSYCRMVGLPWPAGALASAVFLQVRLDYIDPMKGRLKEYFGA